jgi:hypothetical protein
MNLFKLTQFHIFLRCLSLRQRFWNHSLRLFRQFTIYLQLNICVSRTCETLQLMWYIEERRNPPTKKQLLFSNLIKYLQNSEVVTFRACKNVLWVNYIYAKLLCFYITRLHYFHRFCNCTIASTVCAFKELKIYPPKNENVVLALFIFCIWHSWTNLTWRIYKGTHEKKWRHDSWSSMHSISIISMKPKPGTIFL